MESYTDENTRQKTDDLMNCSVRLIHDNNQHTDYKINSGQSHDGPRELHPYIHHFLGALEAVQEQQILILNEDGSERLGPIDIPAGKIPVFRIRSRFYNQDMMRKSIIIGIVDQNSQELHFLDIDGNETTISSPSEHGFTKKIELMPEEIARL